MSKNERPPNILFFFSDQQRWDTCGCYGQRLPITPNLDRLAEEGVRFEHAYTCQPVCGPARACLQTGKYATEVGCCTNNRRLPPAEMTLAKWLAAAGYEVGYVGKWHLASCGPRGGADDYQTRPVLPELRGGYRDYWVASDVLEFTSHRYDGHMFAGSMKRADFPAGRYRVACVTDHVLRFLETRSGERPWFLFVSYIEPHHQNDHNRYEGPHGSKERWSGYEVPGDLVDTGGDWRENYADYLGCCHALDAALGRIRDGLGTCGMAADTLLLYTSDHGSHFRTRNGEYKRSCHDGCIRIPMLAAGPGFRGGRVATNLVSLIDLPPTILRAAGVDVPSSMRGRALQPLAEGQAKGWQDEVFLQISESQVGRALRTRRWKYSVYAPEVRGDAADAYEEQYLYDLAADPHERNNLVSDPAHAKVRTELAARLKARLAGAGERIPEILPARG